MSLPQKDEHVCANCRKTIGKDCSRKRRVIEGYCTEWEPAPNPWPQVAKDLIPELDAELKKHLLE